MKIRERYWAYDYIKVLIVLVGLLVVLTCLCFFKTAKEEQKQATIEEFLQLALQPVGKTMYIWGGGWDDEDSASGAGSTRIGLNSRWKEFADIQSSHYDFTQHRYERENGLDCSGYVGWVIYNTFETEDNQPGYVTTSTDMAQSFAKRGWGRLIENPKKFLPGDIVSMEGHVWICLGTCEDGSVLLVHSSPPGVSICGTILPNTDEEETVRESKAVKLATEYMTKYHPNWQEKYSNRTVDISYLENVAVFRWDESIMSDVKEMQSLSAEEILAYISPTI